MKSIKIYTFICLFIFPFILACGKSSPTYQYVMESNTSPVIAENLPKKTFAVLAVNLPEYLEKNGIVIRSQTKEQLDIGIFNIWAEPLASGISRICREILTKPLLDQGYTVLPKDDDSSANLNLILDIKKLDGTYEDGIILESFWTIRDEKNKILLRGLWSGKEIPTEKSYSAIVKAESKLVQDLSKYIANKITSSPPNKK